MFLLCYPSLPRDFASGLLHPLNGSTGLRDWLPFFPDENRWPVISGQKNLSTYYIAVHAKSFAPPEERLRSGRRRQQKRCLLDSTALGRTAAVVRNRSSVADRTHIDAGGGQRAHGRLTA